MAGIGTYLYGRYLCFLFFVLVYAANCNKYDFGVFENFEATKQSFIKEQKLVKLLSSVKAYYKKIVFSMHQNTNNSPRFQKYVSTLSKMMELPVLINNSIQIRKQQIIIPAEVEFIEFSEQEVNNLDLRYGWKPSEVLEGGKRGLIILQETYNVNIKELVEGSFPNDTTRNSVRKNDFLWPDDLLSMSIIALTTFQRPDNGFMYLNKAMDMLYNMSMHQKLSLIHI